MTQTIEFINDLSLHALGTSTPNLKITHLVFTSKAAIPNETDTLENDNREFDRIELTLTQVGKVIVLQGLITPDKAICPVFNIVSKTGLNQVTLGSGDGLLLEVGDLVEVEEVGGYKSNTIIEKSVDLITLKNNINLDLATTKHAHRMIGRYAVVYGGTADRLSGKVRKWFSIEKFKTASTNTFPFDCKFETGV